MAGEYAKIIAEVIAASNEKKKRKFIEQVDVAFNLKDVDFKGNPKARIKEEIILPHGRGKEVLVGVFAGGESAVKAKEVADAVFSMEQLEEMGDNKRLAKNTASKFDFFVAEASFMVNIGRSIGRALGPRDKMPRPMPPGADPAPMIASLKKTVKVRSKEFTTFHCTIGSTAMGPEALEENFIAVYERIKSKLERGAMNVKSVYVNTTMGPSRRLI